tara:strand:- start:15117 stop:15515 length:399 start_codon:yes stop_codon:yes gene_type:complete
MNYVETIGGKKYQRQLAEQVVDFCIRSLMPRYSTLDISVNIDDLNKDNVKGWCMSICQREFEIEVDKNQSDENLIKTICHEMVHVWQHASGKLYCDHWNNVDHTETEYAKRPWEIQAYEMEETLQKKFLSRK